MRLALASSVDRGKQSARPACGELRDATSGEVGPCIRFATRVSALPRRAQRRWAFRWVEKRPLVRSDAVARGCRWRVVRASVCGFVWTFSGLPAGSLLRCGGMCVVRIAAVGSGENRLVERERELGVLERVAESARAGSGVSVVVEGPPGIGKSHLLSAARTGAAEAGLAVLFARGGELEREFPFGIARQLLEPVVMAADAGERARLLAGAAALSEPVVVGPADGGGVEASFGALHGLYWLAANVASVRPALVVVDDVQWADLASLRWLVFLARRLEGVPLGAGVGDEVRRGCCGARVGGRAGRGPGGRGPAPGGLERSGGGRAGGEVVGARARPDVCRRVL